MINEQLFIDLRQFILAKTGKLYFGRIKQTGADIMVSCPFHKEGQENKPSCGIQTESNDKSPAGTVHCFSCGRTTNIDLMIKEILGVLYNEDEVEARFHLKTEISQAMITKKQEPLFEIPAPTKLNDSILKSLRTYHPYLKERKITEEVAITYDIGYDDFNKQITFPIRDINKKCIGIGRRSILKKQYFYPNGMQKPLYGIYELPKFIRYLWIVEGPFNLWSLAVYQKTGVALLGTGTDKQYKQLLGVNCSGYVLALDPDDAGIKGTYKLGEYLLLNHKFNINVALVPVNKDINDLTEEEFKNMKVASYTEWKRLNGL